MLIDSPLRAGTITLKNLSENDVSANYVSWLNNKDINKFTESRFLNHTLDSIVNFIKSNNASESSLLLGIFENGLHIGNIRSVFDWNHKTASIGLIIGEKNRQGQGIGSQTIQLLTNYIFSNMGIYKVNAGLYESNKGSFFAFEHAGFDEEYRKKSHVINHEGNREDVIMMVKYAS